MKGPDTVERLATTGLFVARQPNRASATFNHHPFFFNSRIFPASFSPKIRVESWGRSQHGNYVSNRIGSSPKLRNSHCTACTLRERLNIRWERKGENKWKI